MEPTSTRQQNNMLSSTSLTKTKSGITVQSVHDHAKISHVVYAAKCNNCEAVYVGYTCEPFNV